METLSWKALSSKIQTLNPEFHELVESIDPNIDMPIYLAEYQYGQIISDTSHLFIPEKSSKGIVYKHTDMPFPLTMVMENSAELYLETMTNTIPYRVYTPGDIFPVLSCSRVFGKYNFTPYNVFVLSSGIRNSLMLQLYSNNASYRALKMQYQLPSTLNPENLLDHSQIFAQICQRENSPWRCKLLYFDNNWLEKIHTDKKWLELKLYLHRKAILAESCQSNFTFLTYAMKDIARQNQLNIKPYTTDIIERMLNVSVGETPGFEFAENETGLPKNLIETAFNQYYGKAYLPLIMQAVHLKNLNQEVYLSLVHNTASLAELKTFRPLSYLHELADVLSIYMTDFKSHLLSQQTIYGELESRINWTFYSERGDKTREDIHSSSQLLNKLNSLIKHLESEAGIHYSPKFPERSPFLKAMVALRLNKI